MTHVITADAGKWITEVGFTPEQESMPNFWREIRTNNPEFYEEVFQDRREEMEKEWQDMHPIEEFINEPEEVQSV